MNLSLPKIIIATLFFVALSFLIFWIIRNYQINIFSDGLKTQNTDSIGTIDVFDVGDDATYIRDTGLIEEVRSDTREIVLKRSGADGASSIVKVECDGLRGELWLSDESDSKYLDSDALIFDNAKPGDIFSFGCDIDNCGIARQSCSLVSR